jgi:hypothetical protein
LEGFVGFSEVKARATCRRVDIDGDHNDLWVVTLSWVGFTANGVKQGACQLGLLRGKDWKN